MKRSYDIVDADGHVLEPADLWKNYIDPEYRDRAPSIIVDKDGKERFLIEGRIFGGPANKILWATDYPHHDGYFPGAPKSISDALPPEMRRQVLAQSAMDFYGLK